MTKPSPSLLPVRDVLRVIRTSRPEPVSPKGQDANRRLEADLAAGRRALDALENFGERVVGRHVEFLKGPRNEPLTSTRSEEHRAFIAHLAAVRQTVECYGEWYGQGRTRGRPAGHLHDGLRRLMDEHKVKPTTMAQFIHHHVDPWLTPAERAAVYGRPSRRDLIKDDAKTRVERLGDRLRKAARTPAWKANAVTLTERQQRIFRRRLPRRK